MNHRRRETSSKRDVAQYRSSYRRRGGRGWPTAWACKRSRCRPWDKKHRKDIANHSRSTVRPSKRASIFPVQLSWLKVVSVHRKSEASHLDVEGLSVLPRIFDNEFPMSWRHHES